MPLIKSSSKKAFKANVEKLIPEVGKYPHVQSKAQALAIAYSEQAEAKKKEGQEMSKFNKIVTPGSVIIEKTAAEFAGVFFDAARSSGMKKIKLQGKVINLEVYKNNPRRFATNHFEKFIPAAVHALIEIISRPNTPPDQKQLIWEAIEERINDKQLNEMGTLAGLPEFENSPLYTPDNEKPKPIIINREQFNG